MRLKNRILLTIALDQQDLSNNVFLTLLPMIVIMNGDEKICGMVDQ